jgi:hypothetical protein
MRDCALVAEQDDNQLSKQLADSSAAFARSALRAQHDDHRVFLLHAATAIEHLAKAILARRHPSLIVASNDFESLLHACGEGAAARRTRTKMRTINATDAIDRAGRFVPTIEALVPDLELLILVRNGVAHLGEASSDDADGVLIAYLKASEELRAALEIDRNGYWGEFVDLVESALKENVQNARLRVESALANARQEFDRRFGALDDPTRQAMLRVIEELRAREVRRAAARVPDLRHPGPRLRLREGRDGRGLGRPRSRPRRRLPVLHVHPERSPLQRLWSRARRSR